MFLSDISIKRPVMATMMNAIIVIFGLFSLPRLHIEQYPNIDFPVVSVYIPYPGANPQSVEEQIIEPIERAVNGISGLEKIDSTALSGAGFFVLRFALERKAQDAAQDVRDKVFAVLGALPPEAETPIIEKANISGDAIIRLSLSSATISFGELSQLVKDKIGPRLQRVEGVGKVESPGQRLREIHVLMDRNRMAGFGISADDVKNSIRSQAIDVPAGKIENENGYFPVRVIAKMRSAEDIASLPLIAKNGSSLQIRNVAEVRDTLAFEGSVSYYNESPTILLSISKQAGANTTAIADGVFSVVDRLKQELPRGVRLDVVTDNSRFVRASIDAVQLDLLFGAILAILIVLVFLRDSRATMISAVALPTAVIGTFAFLNFMGFTLNMMTTLGLSLSIGILIDDAIVVIENIYRHLDMGKTPKEAAKDATAEIGVAVLATTMTICAVFVPVAFMEGIIGRFFYQFGLTVAFAVLISLLVAFTLTPMLASRFLRSDTNSKKKFGISLRIEGVLESIEAFYRRVLSTCLRFPKTTVGVGVLSFIFSIFILTRLDVQFFSRSDQSAFGISFKLPENTPLSVTKAEAIQLSKRIRSYPGVESVITRIAGGTEQNPNSAELSVNLVKFGKRDFSQFELMERVRQDLSKDYLKPKYEISVSAAGGGGGQSKNLAFLFLSDNRAELEKFTEQVAEFMRANLPGAVDIETTKAKPRKEIALLPRLAQASDLGISPIIAATQARTMFEGEKVGRIEDEKGRFDVRMRLSEQDRRNIQDVESVALKSSRGNDVSLTSAIGVEEQIAPSKIERHNGQRQIGVLANYTKNDLSAAVAKVQNFVTANAPESVKMSLEGEADIMQDSIASMLSALLLGIILIYMILCVQYERYLAPFVIMMALPLSFTGAFGALYLTNQPVTIFTMIGLILLMGIVTKNGILLIDFTLHKMSEGLNVHDALMEAGPIRLRPILMTTFAASFGMLPLVVGHGEGGEAKTSMGIAVIGGLVVSTILTLVVVPCLFALMEKFRGMFRKGIRSVN